MKGYNSYNKEEKAWRMSQLLANYLRDELSPEEQAELYTWKEESSRNEILFETLNRDEQLMQDLFQFSLYDTETSLLRVKARIIQQENVGISGLGKKILKSGYLKWMSAAVICMVISAGIYFYKNSISSEQEVVVNGFNAILKTADGKTIDLHNGPEGIVVDNGDVEYDNGTKVRSFSSWQHTDKTEFLELSTTKGAHYQILLPDGTKVRLNSVSTIKFPSRFVGEMRVVELYGEAYFEVKHDKKHPFLVKSNGQEIKVLGTAFNIAAYADEVEIKSTLIRGAVQVVQSGTGFSVRLKPGEQSVLSNKGKLLSKHVVSVEDEVAWLERVITFSNKPFETIMREVSRCCNVEVVYEGNVPNVQLFGSVHYSENMEPILEVLRASNINYSFRGNKLTIKD
jgi:transmembrane sensor